MKHHLTKPPDRVAARSILPGTSTEPLIAASHYSGWIVRPVYHEVGISGAVPEIWLRKGVARRLQYAANLLAPNYQMVLLDGWRSEHVQRELYHSIRAQTALNYPDQTSDQIDQLALNFVSLPDADPVQPSPHLTGGSVDVTLAGHNGRVLNMGSDFDEASDRSWTHAISEGPAAERRQHLLHAMTSAGFTNLASEWWHFDYGNWLWAWYGQKREAIYGPIQSLSADQKLSVAE